MTIETWEQLAVAYEEELRAARKRYPLDYAYPESEVPTVVQKMIAAFKARSYSNSGHGIKGVARRMKIKPTYPELNKFFATLK
jgi:hypothetical protein